jgi:hypothetical protein
MAGVQAATSELFLMDTELTDAPAPKAKQDDKKTLPDISATYEKQQKLDWSSGAMGRVLRTYQGFGGLNTIESLMGQTDNKPLFFKSADGLQLWQGTFFHTGYFYANEKNPDRVKSATPPLKYHSGLGSFVKNTDKWEDSKKPTSTLGTAEAKSDKNSDYTAKYTFHHGHFAGKYPNQAENKYEGYQVTFKSYNNCTDDATAGPFKVVFDVKCDPKGDAKATPVFTPTDAKCKLTFATTSIHGCETVNLSFLEVVRKFMGVIEILFGIALCFIGARFYELAVQILAGCACFVFVMGLGNTFFTLGSTNRVPLIATFVVALVVAIPAGYFSRKFVEAYGIILIAALTLASLGFMLTSAFKMHPALKYGIIIVAAVAGGFLGKRFGELLEMLGTAVIGAAFLTHGAGAYIGGFPSMGEAQFEELRSNWGFLGYLVAWVVLSIGGYFIQWKFFPRQKSKKTEEDTP